SNQGCATKEFKAQGPQAIAGLFVFAFWVGVGGWVFWFWPTDLDQPALINPSWPTNVGSPKSWQPQILATPTATV
ncbi:hypothetical protein, partial [Achromobacter xylosoxidans]